MPRTSPKLNQSSAAVAVDHQIAATSVNSSSQSSVTQTAHASSLTSQALVLHRLVLSNKVLLLSRLKSLPPSLTRNSLKSARATAANALKPLTLQWHAKQRTEHSQSSDQSLSLKEWTSLRRKWPLSPHRADQRRTPTVLPTTTEVDSVPDLTAQLLESAQVVVQTTVDQELLASLFEQIEC